MTGLLEWIRRKWLRWKLNSSEPLVNWFLRSQVKYPRVSIKCKGCPLLRQDRRFKSLPRWKCLAEKCIRIFPKQTKKERICLRLRDIEVQGRQVKSD